MEHQILKVFMWDIGTVQAMHCRCIFVYYHLSFLLERLIRFIKDTTGLLHCGRAKTESIHFSFVPNKMERGSDRSDASWQTLICFENQSSSDSFRPICIVKWETGSGRQGGVVNTSSFSAYPGFAVLEGLLSHRQTLQGIFLLCFLGLSYSLLPNSAAA